MEATKNCTKAIGTIQEAGQQAKSVIDAAYDRYVSCLVVVWYLVMPHLRHICVLLPLVRLYIRYLYVLLLLVIPHVRHARLGLHIAVSWKGRTTHIWSFGYGFSCDTAIECAAFKLFFDTIIVL